MTADILASGNRIAQALVDGGEVSDVEEELSNAIEDSKEPEEEGSEAKIIEKILSKQ